MTLTNRAAEPAEPQSRRCADAVARRQPLQGAVANKKRAHEEN